MTIRPLVCLILGPMVLIACASDEGVRTGGSQGVPGTGDLVALLPFRNLTRSPDLPELLREDLKRALVERGHAFVPAADLEDLLTARRIRYTDSLSREAARVLANGTGARFLLLGTILEFDEIEPSLSLAVRVLEAESGRRICSSITTLRGRDFEGLLGVGTLRDPDELRAEVVVRVIDELSFVERSEREPESSPEQDPPSSALFAYRREGFDPGTVGRLALLPFDNRTLEPEASEMFTEVLAATWFRGYGIEVVEASELMSALIAEKVRMIQALDLEVLARVADRLGTRYVVTGSLDRFSRNERFGTEDVPAIEASLQILDLQEKHIVSALALERRGDDYHLALGLGTVRHPVALATRLARELIAGL